MTTTESTTERTEAEMFAAAGLVCPNGCAPGTGWTFHRTELVDVAYRVGHNKFGMEILYDVSESDKRYVEDDGEARYECDGCDFELPECEIIF
jgi:hypothetical protein